MGKKKKKKEREKKPEKNAADGTLLSRHKTGYVVTG